jgi:hypothetical protein
MTYNECYTLVQVSEGPTLVLHVEHLRDPVLDNDLRQGNMKTL